jgi:hypothetical protein
MNRLTKCVLVVPVILTAAACSNVKKMSDIDRSRLQTICVTSPDEITYPDEAFFMSHGQGWAMGVGVGIGGAIGGAIAAGASGEKKVEKELITEYLLNTPNSFSEELVVSLQKNMESVSTYRFSCDEPFDAKLSIDVVNYGISYVPFTKSYRPTLTLKSELIDSDGNALWKNKIAEYATSDIAEKRRRDLIFSRPDLMLGDFVTVANSIISRFALHFSGVYEEQRTYRPR